MRGAVAGIVALVALLASLIAGGGATRHPRVHVAAAQPSSAPLSSPTELPAAPPSDPIQLALDVNRAQQIIDNRTSATAALASAGRFEQLATGKLLAEPSRVRRSTLDSLDPPAAATIRANLAAAATLARLNPPRTSLPPWRIIQPPAPGALLGYFKAAQSRFGVPWQYLAAIEFIETRFGRVDGLSTAGAEGPMQFIPATWAAYGSGDVHNPHNAVMGAARYLDANGAPGDMPDAIYHYNSSSDYVHAVEDYAGRMHADPRAYYGYYYWQVFYRYRGRLVILPTGFPKLRPVPLQAEIRATNG
jgi:Transglycosylase SLT domain